MTTQVGEEYTEGFTLASDSHRDREVPQDIKVGSKSANSNVSGDTGRTADDSQESNTSCVELVLLSQSFSTSNRKCRWPCNVLTEIIKMLPPS